MFDPNAVTRAKKLADNHFKMLDHETFYLLAREMQTRLFDVCQLQLAQWLREKSAYAPVKIRNTKKGKDQPGKFMEMRRTKTIADYVEQQK